MGGLDAQGFVECHNHRQEAVDHQGVAEGGSGGRFNEVSNHHHHSQMLWWEADTFLPAVVAELEQGTTVASPHGQH